MPEDESPELRGLAIVARFRDLPVALLAQGILDSAGIESHLVDDNTIRMDWLWSNLLGGVKIAVMYDDIETATQLLNQPIPETIELEDATSFSQPKCPRCESLDLSFEELYAPIAYGSLFVNFPLPVQRAGWICHSCRHTWHESQL